MSISESVPVGKYVEIEYDMLASDGVNINHFRVKPEHTGNGYGRDTFKKIIEYFNRAGHEYICVNIGTQGPVKKMLLKNGFNIEEEHRNHITAIREL
jgi:predicted GNAT family acetyltransferase